MENINKRTIHTFAAEHEGFVETLRDAYRDYDRRPPVNMAKTRLLVRDFYEMCKRDQPARIVEVQSPLPFLLVLNLVAGKIKLQPLMTELFGPLADPRTRELPDTCKEHTKEILETLVEHELRRPGWHQFNFGLAKAALEGETTAFESVAHTNRGFITDVIRDRRGNSSEIETLLIGSLAVETMNGHVIPRRGLVGARRFLHALGLKFIKALAEYYTLPHKRHFHDRALLAADIFLNAPNIIMMEHTVWILQQPEETHYDPEGRLHSDAGPAVRYRDGFDIHVWRGVSFPRQWLKRPPHAATALQMRNIEMRRIACEISGWDNIINELEDVQVIDKDPDPTIGTLIRAKAPAGDEGGWWEYREKEWWFLRVKCGTGRTFALPVPPGMSTAREANAWTYGLAANDYNPEVRT